MILAPSHAFRNICKKCEVQLSIYSQTSTVQPLNVRNGSIISSRTLLGAWSLICYKWDPRMTPLIKNCWKVSVLRSFVLWMHISRQMSDTLSWFEIVNTLYEHMDNIFFSENRSVHWDGQISLDFTGTNPIWWYCGGKFILPLINMMLFRTHFWVLCPQN